MSDTDDTDLLLLIPPDFFLVHSPDIDSDCDISFSFDRDEVKDSIVSDLITHVNDLESRICMIESLDRSITCCSSYIEDSFVNQQSINSLTESDILRSQIGSNTKNLAFEISNDSHMLESIEGALATNILPDSNSLVDNLGLPINNINQQTSAYVTPNCENTKPNNEIRNKLNLAHDTIDNPKYNIERKELINEIDSFLEVKNKHVNPQLSDVNESRQVSAQLNYNNDSDMQINSTRPKPLLEPYDCQLNLEDKDRHNIALPEVFELLKEMEQTQHEIERKLKYREPDLQSERANIDDELPPNKTGNATTNNVTSVQQTLGYGDCNSSNVYQLLNKQTENIHGQLKSVTEGNYRSPERYKHFRPNSSNTQVSYLFKPKLYGDSLFKKDCKSIPLQSRSPADAVVSDPSIKSGRDPIFHSDNNKELPRKISSFRRHLDFEHPEIGLSQNQTQPQSIPHHIDELKNNKKSVANYVSSSNNRQSVFPDGTNTYISTHQTTINKGNHNEIPNTGRPTENDPSQNLSLQRKISSNKLLSLSELWNKEPSFYSDDPNKLRQKLEEEKYRRQHCEQQIQALQLRVLEEQERLAVAVQVDQEKDKAIVQITESWRKLNNHWNELEEQRHSLAQQLQKEKEISKAKIDELMKKVERWEKEVSQALDLAAGYKEKSETVQMQMDLVKKNTDEKISEVNSQLSSLIKENEKIAGENENLLAQVDGCRKRIDEEERLLSKLKVELEKCKKKCSEYQAEINVLKEQKESLANKIKDEKGRNNILEQQKNALQQAYNEATKKEKAAQDEARVSNERIEVARTELRALYQGQLEAVVKEKLQEFQCQLEAAEAALKAELQSKEKQLAEKANDQCRQLHEKHMLELYQKEESYRSEIGKWKTRLMESEKLRSVSESKLQEETSRRAEIAHRLHSVMETQWREALNIISNPLQNAYEVTKEDGGNKWASNSHSSERLKFTGDVKASNSNSTTSMSQTDEVPFCKEGLVTSRTTQPQQEQQLKKYIQMLLERGPGNPNESIQESLDQNFSQESTLGGRYMVDNAKKSVGLERFGNSSKPPWK